LNRPHAAIKRGMDDINEWSSTGLFAISNEVETEVDQREKVVCSLCRSSFDPPATLRTNGIGKK
jgi:hypothetical protein